MELSFTAKHFNKFIRMIFFKNSRILTTRAVNRNKQLLFGDCIGHKERFITRDNFTTKAVVDAMETAMNEGYDRAFKEEYCKTIKVYLERFFKSQVL